MRTLPHVPETEKFIIGCCLCDQKSIGKCVEAGVTEGHFYDSRNGFWFGQIVAEQPADVVALFQKTKSHELFEKSGGIAYLNLCQNSVTSLENLPLHLGLLIEKHVLRKMYYACVDIAQRVHEGQSSLEDFLSHAERTILSIRPQSNLQAKTIRELVVEATGKIEMMMTKSGITGLSTGLTDLDSKTDGLHDGDMIVVAAYPSVGKSALAGNIIFHNALKGIPCAFFTAEMNPVKIVMRALAGEARANLKRLHERDGAALVSAAGRIAKAPIYIENVAGMTIHQVIAKARRLRQQHGIKLAAIDYLQLVSSPDADSREQEVSAVSKGIKQIAMELDIPVLALSQLNDDGKLRESRAIGQDGDEVWILEPDKETNEEAACIPVTIKIKKAREGERGPVKVIFFRTFTRFEDAEKIQSTDMPYKED